MSITTALAPLRAHGGQRRTSGLDDATLERLAPSHPELAEAIEAAAAEYARIRDDFADLLELDESAQIETVQDGYDYYYAYYAANPYVAPSVCSTWIV